MPDARDKEKGAAICRRLNLTPPRHDVAHRLVTRHARLPDPALASADCAAPAVTYAARSACTRVTNPVSMPPGRSCFPLVDDVLRQGQQHRATAVQILAHAIILQQRRMIRPMRLARGGRERLPAANQGLGGAGFLFGGARAWP